MRWILRRWFLAGGMRSFLAGYAGCPPIIGLVAAIVFAIARHSAAELVTIVPAMLSLCVLAPFGLIAGMVCGVSPGWGPWDGRLVYMGLMAGLVVLVIVGRRLEKRNPVLDVGDGTPRVPTARVVTAHLFPTVAWKQLIGPSLLVIAGMGFLILGWLGLSALSAA